MAESSMCSLRLRRSIRPSKKQMHDRRIQESEIAKVTDQTTDPKRITHNNAHPYRILSREPILWQGFKSLLLLLGRRTAFGQPTPLSSSVANTTEMERTNILRTNEPSTTPCFCPVASVNLPCEGVLRPSRFTTGDGGGFHGSRALTSTRWNLHAREEMDETARVVGIDERDDGRDDRLIARREQRDGRKD
jgi:hypothetical protein